LGEPRETEKEIDFGIRPATAIVVAKKKGRNGDKVLRSRLREETRKGRSDSLWGAGRDYFDQRAKRRTLNST